MDGDPELEWAHMATWLDRALSARKARDEWRAVGPILRHLRDAEVPWKVITAWTGISRATGSRMLATARRS